MAHAAPTVAPTDPQGVLAASRAFAEARNAVGAWQVVSTLAVLVALLAAVRWLEPHPARLLLGVALTGVFVRVFVLQHDCGHLSLFRGRRLNDAVGRALSGLTGIAYHAWRSEHNWHHANQGRLSRRGVDRMNSPMTVEEALEDPEGAARRRRTITGPKVFCLGALSLLAERKRPRAFFMFRPKFRWPVPDRAALIRSVRLTNLGHVAAHAALILGVGAWNWALVVVPAMVVGGGLGALLFWVQHNFEGTYHAEDGAWSYVEVALKGSSYMRLPWPLSWCTAQIGLHHVHHLNPLIPNYRLEEARRALPEVACVAPLSFADLGRCFTHVFWDGGRGRMVTAADLGEALPDAA